MDFGNVYKGKTVFLTGHTGFKGSWLSEWLLLLGAKVVGYSLEPPSDPSHFEALELGKRIHADIRADIRDLERMRKEILHYEPDFIFHLAAQSLVGEGFKAPHYTVETNVTGTVNVLEALRQAKRNCIVIMITTDKVYENMEWEHGYRETDPLGGYDPYSASKACAEIMISSYRRSFFINNKKGTPRISVASVRGGNVIGGGDWAANHIVPDSITSLVHGQPIPVRNKKATRPWQHVLELLSGYMHLGSEIALAVESQDEERCQKLSSAFNFGPHVMSNKTVESLVEEILKNWPGEWKDLFNPNANHEAGQLNIAIDKAYHVLGWAPRWSFEETIKQTVDWYRAYYGAENVEPELLRKLTQGQIRSFSKEVNYQRND